MGIRTVLRQSRGEVRRILLGGDICPLPEQSAAIASGKGRSIIAGVKKYFDAADLAVVQWETVLTSKLAPIRKSGPNLANPPESVRLAVDFGADVALLANNHIGDQGEDAVMETVSLLEKAGIRTVGAGRNQAEAGRPLVIDLGGLKIGILNVAEHEFGTAAATAPGAAALEPLDNIAAIRELRGQVDFLLMTIHGGHEFNPWPSPRMVRTYRAFAEAGADAVFGCHTHCGEAMEIYGGRSIVYSPGNLYFPPLGDTMPSWSTGYLTMLEADRDGVAAVEVIPYRFTGDAIMPLEGEAERDFEAHFSRQAEPLDDPARLEEVFDIWSSVAGRHYVMQFLEALTPLNFDFLDPENAARYLHLRNTYTCESHRDIVDRFLRLVETGRLEKAAAGYPLVTELQHPKWMEC